MAEVTFTTKDGRVIEATHKEYFAANRVHDMLIRFVLSDPKHLKRAERMLTVRDVPLFEFQDLPTPILMQLAETVDNEVLLNHYGAVAFSKIIHVLCEDYVNFEYDEDLQDLPPMFMETRNRIRRYLETIQNEETNTVDCRIKLNGTVAELKSFVKELTEAKESIRREIERTEDQLLEALDEEDDL